MNDASNTPRKNFLIGSLIIIWLAATLFGLWWFQQQTIRPFISTTDNPGLWQAKAVEKMFQSTLKQLPDRSSNANVVLFHFWNPSCLCNQVSQRHFNGILSAFDKQQLRVIALTPSTTSQQQIDDFLQLNGKRIELLQTDDLDLPLSASPGLALFNRVKSKDSDSDISSEYRMGYFGAYGFGALCTVANDDFFPNIIRKMQKGPYGPFVNVAGDGCFCAWDSGKETTGG